MAKEPKRYAKLLDNGMVEIHPDAKTVVVVPFRESLLEDWPELEPPKPKRGRRKKVTDDAQGDAESSSE